MEPQRNWLDVTYEEKDDAKEAGARWDNSERRWFAPPGREEALKRWAAAPDIPGLLPGEDRTLGAGLFVDLVPRSCWFTNVRTCVAPQDWQRLRRMITTRAGQRCEICGATQDASIPRWLEGHERWAYDEERGVQTLRRLICLCTACHHVTHFGFAQVTGREEEAFAHLMAVTGMSQAAARAHIDEAFAVWENRSNRSYDLDLSMLTGAGVSLAVPPDAEERAAASEDGLRGM
nr:DUF5710 domain-containing protein [Streptomyces sp. NBC_00830]